MRGKSLAPQDSCRTLSGDPYSLLFQTPLFLSPLSEMSKGRKTFLFANPFFETPSGQKNKKKEPRPSREELQ